MYRKTPKAGLHVTSKYTITGFQILMCEAILPSSPAMLFFNMANQFPISPADPPRLCLLTLGKSSRKKTHHLFVFKDT